MADLKALAEDSAAKADQAAKAAQVLLMAIEQQAEEPGPVEMTTTDVTDSTISVRWTSTSLRFTSWEIGRDGVDSSGYPEWKTRLPMSAREQKFTSLLPNTIYTVTLLPLSNVTEQPVTLKVRTKASNVPPPSTDTAAARFNWGDPDPISDEFDYEGKPNPQKWLYCGNYGEGWEGHEGNGRRMPENTFVGNGMMTLRGDTNGNTGWIRQNKTVTYGRWEVRSRSRNTGANGGLYHPLSLIWPVPEGWPRFGEYDFVEYFDPNSKKVSAYQHYPHPNMPVEQEIFHKDLDCTQFQNYGFEWTKDHLRGFINGEIWYTVSGGANPRRGNIQSMPAGRLTHQLDNFTGDGGLRPAVFEIEWSRFYPLR